jgi:hypothetical protein
MTTQTGAHEGAPLDRPALHTVLLELEGELAAPPREVFSRLIEEIAPADGHTKFGVYPQAQTAVLQGDWWYRGEYRVTPAAGGARVSYVVVNVAQVKHEAGGQVGAKTVEAAPGAFERHLEVIRAGLV